MQVKEFLQQQGYRGDVMRIEGSNFQASEWKQGVAQMAGYMWMGGLGMQFFGEALFNNLGITNKPAFYVYLKENPMQVLGGLFLVNNVASSQLATGAFEVYLDDVLIYSKLETGHVPNGDQMVGLLRDHGVSA